MNRRPAGFATRRVGFTTRPRAFTTRPSASAARPATSPTRALGLFFGFFFGSFFGSFFGLVLRRAKRALVDVRLGLLAPGEATELYVLWILLDVFLPGREAGYVLVRLEFLRVVLALGKPTARRPEGPSGMRPPAIAAHVVSSS